MSYPTEELENTLIRLAEDDSWRKYQKLVYKNAHLIKSFDEDFWSELVFSTENTELIRFWINYPGRRMRIIDLQYLSPEQERSFQDAMDIYDLDMTDYESVIQALEIKSNGEEDDNIRNVYDFRIAIIRSKVSRARYVISFERVSQMLTTGRILRFEFEDRAQLVPSSNLTATFYARDGKVYLAELQYNAETNQIFPPTQ